jgi:fructokinase
MSGKTILAFGEILWDLLPDDTLLGGAPFNFSYRMHQLGERALFTSRIGRDIFGQKAFQQVLELGLTPHLIQWDDQHPTGTVQVSFDREHNPDYVIIPGVAYDYIEPAPELIQAAATADCICFGTLIQRTPSSQQTCYTLLQANTACLKFYDINLRKNCFSYDCIVRSLQHADALKLNEHEAVQLAGILGMPFHSIPAFCRDMLQKWTLQYCIVTLAERGAFVAASTQPAIYEPGYEINLADSLGAGDAFSAGFIHKILHQAAMREAVAFGNVLGALVASKRGATHPVTLQEITSFPETHSRRIVDEQLSDYIS